MPIDIKFEIQSSLNLDGVFGQINDAAIIGVANAGEELLNLSKEEAPMDTATLAGSGAVTFPIADKGRSALVTYDTPYAARLHEGDDFNFSTASNPNAKAKYLEDPALQNADDLLKIVGQKIRNEGAQ